MAASPPTWLNDAFFEKALRSDGKRPKLTVISSEVGRATQPGDNFGSAMYRAALKIKENNEVEDTSVIIKCVLKVEDQIAARAGADGLITEAKMFSEINVLMLEKAFIEEFQPFAAKCFYTCTEPPHEAIVLEDLKREGFRLASVSLGLDLKHCLLVMRKIAQFHASSLILQENDPNCFDSFTESIFIKHPKSGMGEFLRISVKDLVKEMGNWPGYEKYIEPLKNLIPTGMDHWIEALRRDDTGFNVLIHGDMWLNNLMFRYTQESEDVEHIRFVDFQLSCVTSAAIDLQYFFNTSVSPDVLENNLDELIDEYYNTLCQTLSKLGHPNLRPTLNMLNSELQKKGVYGTLACFSIRTVALGDRNHVPDLVDIITNDGGLHLSSAYIAAIKKMLPLYEKLGWLKI